MNISLPGLIGKRGVKLLSTMYQPCTKHVPVIREDAILVHGSHMDYTRFTSWVNLEDLTV